MALVPLGLLALGRGPAGAAASSRALDADIYRHVARLATFSVLPLLPARELGAKVALLCLEEASLRALLPPAETPRKLASALEYLHLAALAALFLLKEVAYPLLLPRDLAARLEFLPLMLTSVYCAAWLSGFALLSGARLAYVAYRGDAAAW